jgi:hypothetical protein
MVLRAHGGKSARRCGARVGTFVHATWDAGISPPRAVAADAEGAVTTIRLRASAQRYAHDVRARWATRETAIDVSVVVVVVSTD